MQRICSVVLFLFLCGLFAANAETETPGTPIYHEVSTEAKPWTHLDMHNDPDAFQFALVSDNAGGPRQGIFAESILKLNLLQPEFVVGIGDFIEGYVDLREDLELQWERFMEDLDPLEMPFFFLPGNHDNGRPLWAEVYNDRFGVPYYHVIYKNVLFLFLSTNDGPKHNTGIGEKQIGYFKKVLNENTDVRWTLVFQHKPLWNDEGAQGWTEIAELLEGRKCTVFAGHTHHYLSQFRDGISFITLATTGGGSALRGPNYGEFDQVAWITMTDEGPRVANLLLDGILDKDFRTEKEAKELGLFLADKAITATPIHIDSATFTSGVSHLKILNPRDEPFRVKILFETAPGMRMEPASLATIIPPGATHEVDLNVVADVPIPLSETQPVVLHWEGHYDNGDNNPSIDLEGEYRIPIDGKYGIPYLEKSPTLDGDVSEWKALPFQVDQPGEIFFNSSAWKGPEDGSFQFGVGEDEQFLYVGVKALDNEPCFEGWKYWEDFALVSVDARASDLDDPKKSVFGIAVGPQMSAEQGAEYEFGAIPKTLQRASIGREDGFEAEIAIPLSYLEEKQNGDWKEVRLNVSVSDFDTRDERDGVTILCWKPQWTGRRNDPEAGVFLRSAETSHATTEKISGDLRVLTFNVKVDIEEDSNVPAWNDRKDLCAEVVKEARPDLLGLQETSPNQLDFFQNLLEGYEVIGELPLSSEEKELFETLFPPLKEMGFEFYTDAILMVRTEVFQILDQGHWWLSPTPDTASIGFGNYFPRVAVWARLKHKPTGRELLAVNTHFDNSAPSQEHMAKLCHEKLQAFVDEGLPILFFGDFNTNQQKGDYPLLTSGGWKDSYLASSQASETGRDDNVPTALGRSRIDHIFYHGEILKAIEWKRLESPDPSRALSDHYPVLSVLTIE